MLGIYEIIALALSLGGFGVNPNPKAPSADVVLEYAVEDADVIAYVDAVPLITGNYQALTKLPEAPQIKASPALRDAVGKAIAEVEGARGLVKTAIGVDLTTDLSNATMFVRMGTPQPQLLLVVRGKFPADVVAKVAKMTQARTESIGGTPAVAVGGAFEMLAVTRGGVALLGNRALITPRLAAGWKAPARPKGSPLATTAKLLADHPVYLVAATPASTRFQKTVMGTAGSGASSGGAEVAAFLKRFQFVGAAVFHNGLAWTIHDADAAAHGRSVMASEGWIDLLRAAHLAPRGFARIMLSFVEDLRGSDPGIALLKKHKTDLLKLVDQYTGDGTFKVKWDKDPRAHTLTVRATGKRLSDVLPFGFLVPVMAWGMIAEKPVPPPAPPPPMRPAPRPRSGGGITTPPAPQQKKPPAPTPRP